MTLSNFMVKIEICKVLARFLAVRYEEKLQRGYHDRKTTDTDS